MKRPKRDQTIGIKASIAERDHWMTLAIAEGIPLSSKIRMMLIKVYGMPEEEPAEEKV